MKKYKIRILFLVVAYLVTWIGGYFSHKQELSEYAAQLHADAVQADKENMDFYKQEGIDHPPRPIARLGGPVTRVTWIFPILPGILLTDSSYVIGPTYGRGGIKIVFFYGFGSFATEPIYGWIS